MLPRRIINRLKKLSAYLKAGNLQSQFDMYSYYSPEDSGTWDKTCGSVGCAVGHGPFAGIPKRKADDWRSYAHHNFTDGVENIFDWCFDGEWKYTDNTPEGAAMRIDYVVNHKEAPPFRTIRRCINSIISKEDRILYYRTFMKENGFQVPV